MYFLLMTVSQLKKETFEKQLAKFVKNVFWIEIITNSYIFLIINAEFSKTFRDKML